MINKTDIHKFSFPEMVSGGNGKTSGTGCAGIYLILIGSLCFIFGVLKSCSDIMIQSLALVSLGSALLGIKKFNPTKDTTNTEGK
ncbi:MAG: hypothetical protein PHR38_10040 [Bacteroidales bacterium]|nr:hypothetical protein [Bacteroidales bacterium]